MAKGANVLPIGTMVKFTGYTDTEEMEDEDFLLEDGQEAPIVAIDEEEESYTLEIPNPDFDDSKRKSKGNPATIKADAFYEEVEAVDAEEEEGEEEEETAPAPKKKATAKKKAAPKKKAAAKGRATPKKKATTKKKAAPPAQEEESEDSVDADGREALENEDEEILGMVEGVSSDELLELAHEMVEEASTADYKVGGILYHVRLTGAYQDVNEDYASKGGFERYINEELGMEYRKAMYLIDIYYKFNQFGIGSDVVASVGWTKASQIARVMTEENADALIEAAESSTVADLKEIIVEDFSGETGSTRSEPAKKKVTFKFRLFEDQASPVEQYLAQAEETLGLNDLNQTFEHIVTEWASDHLDVRAQQKTKRKVTTKKAPSKKAAVKKKVAAKKKAPAQKAPAKKAAPKRKVAPKRKAAPKKKATARR